MSNRRARLCLCRPQTSLDEELFSRLVQLDGLRTRARLREERLYHEGRDPHRWRQPAEGTEYHYYG